MRGMLSVDESELPSLFLLVSPDLVHVFLAAKGGEQGLALAKNSGAASMQTKAESKLWSVYYLYIVCQLTGRVMHKPIKLRIPGAKVAALLKKAATPIKVAFGLLKLGMAVANVSAKGSGVGLVPFPSSLSLSIDG
jgi:hypothetical protein